MKKITLLLFSLLFLINFSSFGEGTAQLMPDPNVPASIQIWDGGAARNSFTYGAPADKRLFFRVGANPANETVYFGFGNILDNTNTFGAGNWNNGNNNRLHFRIFRPDGTLFATYNNVLVPTNGAVGHIDNHARAVAGPSQLIGATGYNALHLQPDQAGDWWIEFNRDNDPTDRPVRKTVIRFIDITVSTGKGSFGSNAGVYVPGGTVNTGTAINGRLFSRAWDIQCYADDNPFSATMYAYTTDQIVLGINFNEMEPFGFVINMNSFGVNTTGNVQTNRQSIAGLPTVNVAEYPIFLNDPDPVEFPSGQIPDLQVADVEARACGEYVVRIEINAAGFVEALLDFNSTGFYEPNTVDVLLSGGFVPTPVAPATTSTVFIPWNGLDGLGNPVPQGTVVDFIAYVQSGLTHLPLYDVENHDLGYSVFLQRPTLDIGGNIVPPPNLFWDDTNLGGGTIELNGATSPAHSWPNNFGDLRTLNTWFYIRRVQQESEFIMDNLNFGILDNGASGVCTTGQNNEFDNITFTVTINPTKYEAWQLNYTTIINNGTNYTLNLVDVDSSGADYNIIVDPGPPLVTLPRRDIFITYEVIPTPETNALDFDFIVDGNVASCPSTVSDQTSVVCDDILLPITLLDFNARHYSDNRVLVDWQTANERDNQGFYVQRSLDGEEFKDLTFVIGKGTTSNQSSYEFIDEEYWTGIAYYRLAQLDYNGEITLTKSVKIERNFTNLPFILYPNPNRAGEELNLRGITDKSSIQNLQIISITGQQVLVNPPLKSTFDGVAIDLPQKMAKGIYIIQFVTEFGIQNYKFIIE